MARETEIKLRVADKAALLKKLRLVGARTVAAGSGRVHEWNTLYDTPGQDLRGKDLLLRVRVETPTDHSSSRNKKRFILTFKGPVKGARPSSAKRSTDEPSVWGQSQGSRGN
jgi:adenylate cyclase class IV